MGDIGGTTGRALRIGMVAPPWYPVPPPAYGGTEAVVAALVDQLVARGHEVTLVASGDPGTAAQRYLRIYDEPPSHLLGHSALPELVMAIESHRALADLDLDLVHDHSAAGPLLALGRRRPTLVTMHGPVDGDHGTYYRGLGTAVGLIAISEAQRRITPDLNWVGTVYNAVDVPSFPFTPNKGDDVVWLGRFCADKGPDLAIEVARRAGRRIVLAGKLNETAEHEYFDEVIAPMLGPDVEYVGEADAAMKRELLAGAACLLFPIQWDEPFGLVMTEAMACGTPVVATPRGSVPEIVRHGETGFVCSTTDELVEALGSLDRIDPSACRRDVEARFDLPVMAAGYERVYREILEEPDPAGQPRRLSPAA